MFVYKQDQRSQKVAKKRDNIVKMFKLNPGSTEMFEIKVRNLDLFGTSVKTFKECVHQNSERYFI